MIGAWPLLTDEGNDCTGAVPITRAIWLPSIAVGEVDRLSREDGLDKILLMTACGLGWARMIGRLEAGDFLKREIGLVIRWRGVLLDLFVGRLAVAGGVTERMDAGDGLVLEDGQLAPCLAGG